MTMVLKDAELANAARPFEIAERWTAALYEEFWSQGDLELAEGLPIVSALNKREMEDVFRGRSLSSAELACSCSRSSPECSRSCRSSVTPSESTSIGGISVCQRRRRRTARADQYCLINIGSMIDCTDVAQQKDLFLSRKQCLQMVGRLLLAFVSQSRDDVGINDICESENQNPQIRHKKRN
jgi:hypothetical protein